MLLRSVVVAATACVVTVGMQPIMGDELAVHGARWAVAMSLSSLREPSASQGRDALQRQSRGDRTGQ